MLKGLVYSLVGSVFFGFTQVLVRVGVVEFGSAIVGNIVSTAAALLTIFVIFAFTGGFHGVVALDSKTTKFLSASGLFAGLGQILRYIALAFVPIVFFAPLIMAGSTLSTIALSHLFIRGLERVNWRVVLGAILTIVGAFLIITT